MSRLARLPHCKVNMVSPGGTVRLAGAALSPRPGQRSRPPASAIRVSLAPGPGSASDLARVRHSRHSCGSRCNEGRRRQLRLINFWGDGSLVTFAARPLFPGWLKSAGRAASNRGRCAFPWMAARCWLLPGDPWRGLNICQAGRL